MQFTHPLPTIADLNKNQPRRKITLELAAREPFRLFFPAATLVGICGVALWPLHLLGVTGNYPGQVHAQVMTHGFFGGFIFGFLGTAMPRMLSARQLRVGEALPLLAVYLAMVGVCLAGNLVAGSALFLAFLGGFAGVMAPRIRQRKELPPPGFVLVGLSLLCAATGAIMALSGGEEPGHFRVTLQRLLTYQGFVLLPILGIGPFILPRFFGLASSHDLPESLCPSSNWLKKAIYALSAGALIIGSFVLEANGVFRLAYGIRFIGAAGYIFIEMPLRQGPESSNAFGKAIRIALAGMLAGFFAVAIFPAYRVGLLHLTLVGGFALITLVVATRVLFGHSGNIARLRDRNRWFTVAVGLMLFGMTTRISGDVWPMIMATHYIYGAILWIVGVLLWAIFTLPKALQSDDSE